MSDNTGSGARTDTLRGRPIKVVTTGAVLMLLAIIATLVVSRRSILPFVAREERYVVATEAAMLSILVVELVVRLLSLHFSGPRLIERGTRLRLIVRIVGYSTALLSEVSILASNAALGISVGAVVGVAIAFAAQNVVGGLLAAVLILGTRMVRVGEEIVVNQTRGIVSDISLTHTVLSVEEDVVFIPNSLLISAMVRRKRRSAPGDAAVRDW